MQDERRCYVSGAAFGLDLHHIYKGNPNRKISDEKGFWVYLRHDIHMALHDHRKPFETLERDLREEFQRKYEETHTREQFRALIGCSYL